MHWNWNWSRIILHANVTGHITWHTPIIPDMSIGENTELNALKWELNVHHFTRKCYKSHNVTYAHHTWYVRWWIRCNMWNGSMCVLLRRWNTTQWPVQCSMPMTVHHSNTELHRLITQSNITNISIQNSLCTCNHTNFSETKQVAQLLQRERAAGWVSYGQNWKTWTGRQHFTDIIGLSSTTVM